jgi:hypothetical protein
MISNETAPIQNVLLNTYDCTCIMRICMHLKKLTSQFIELVTVQFCLKQQKIALIMACFVCVLLVLPYPLMTADSTDLRLRLCLYSNHRIYIEAILVPPPTLSSESHYNCNGSSYLTRIVGTIYLLS